jgi:hypothetical protein
VNGKKLSPAGIVILVAGTIAFLASFLAFYKFTTPTIHFGSTTVGGSKSFNAWSQDAFFPLSALPALFGLIMAVQIAVTTFADVSLPKKVLGFDWKQIHLLLGIQGALLMICFLVRDNSVLDFGLGFWLMLLASIALVIGAVIAVQEPASAPGANGPPPAA